MNIQNLIALCVLVFILRCQRITSSTADNNKYSGADEYGELVKRLLDITDYKDQVKINNQQIEELQKTNEDLRKTIGILGESVRIQKANTAKLDDFINNTIYKQMTEIEDLKLKSGKSTEEGIVIQDNFKKEIEQLKNQVLASKKQMEDSEKQLEIERNLRERLEEELPKTSERIREMKERAKNDFEDNKLTDEKLPNKIKELDSQVLFYRKQLEESQNQLTDRNRLSLLKIKEIENNITECKNTLKRYIKLSCKGLGEYVYDIHILGMGKISLKCSTDVNGDDGWIQIYGRYDNNANSFVNWKKYRDGFGYDFDGNFFIGLEKLYQITNLETFELYIKLVYGDKTDYVRYDNFRIGNEDSGYALESLGKFNGTVPDEMRRNLNQKFSTYDRDNDRVADKNCALEYSGAWWFDDCDGPNLFGRYGTSYHILKRDLMSWDRIFFPRYVEMFIRPIENIS